MQFLPEPEVKEAPVSKLDGFDPHLLAEAYDRFLNGDGLEDLMIELNIPRNVMLYHAKRDKWLKHRDELMRTLRTEADQKYLEHLSTVRLPTAKRQLRIAQKLEEAVEKTIDAIKDSPQPDDKMLRRLAETLSSAAGVSSRAAGITDRPAPVAGSGGQGANNGKQPLIMIGLSPKKEEKENATVIDVSEFKEEEL